MNIDELFNFKLRKILVNQLESKDNRWTMLQFFTATPQGIRMIRQGWCEDVVTFLSIVFDLWFFGRLQCENLDTSQKLLFWFVSIINYTILYTSYYNIPHDITSFGWTDGKVLIHKAASLADQLRPVKWTFSKNRSDCEVHSFLMAKS